MTPRRKTSAELYDAAFAAMEVAQAESRLEAAASESRIARLKHAKELLALGAEREALSLVKGVEREQERLR